MTNRQRCDWCKAMKLWYLRRSEDKDGYTHASKANTIIYGCGQCGRINIKED